MCIEDEIAKQSQSQCEQRHEERTIHNILKNTSIV
ncbi:hypothetical protein EV695_3436 [Cocleimonas flava]|uniref:Uncharacterized protein n=1 Tax=Cocleimonas flava TaxID=634765 RepID=A0A4R1ESG6_9GAMM|nr:hypothetical protein EV695_3436 [Cocleimonas flava]